MNELEEMTSDNLMRLVDFDEINLEDFLDGPCKSNYLSLETKFELLCRKCKKEINKKEIKKGIK